MLSKAVVKARPSVLWCYKKELGFSRQGFLFTLVNITKPVKDNLLSVPSRY